MKPAKGKLTEVDYDFSDVKSRDEQVACCWYEYARESDAAASEITAIRKQRTQSKGRVFQTMFGPRIQDQIQSHILIALSMTKGFPCTPWRNLSDKDRQTMMKIIALLPMIERYMLTAHDPPLSFALNLPGTTTLDEWTRRSREWRRGLLENEPIKVGFFAVNLKYGHSVLIEEFTKYLRHFEGKPMMGIPAITKKVAQPPGRQSIHDSLNALGIMRLRYYCNTFSEAQKKMQELKGKSHGLFYGRRDNANRACNFALRQFQQLFGWLDSAKPIHFTEGWRGGLQNKKAFLSRTQK